jgi:hypothetical protein
MVKTTVEILDKSLNKVAEIKNLAPINNSGMILRYSKELSDYGKCMFRVRSDDPLFTALGDVLQPHVYNVRIKRGTTTVWQGAIVNNPERTKNFVEVEAVEYLYYLDKMLIRRDAETTAGDGKDNYRTFTSGTMASAINTLVTNAKSDFGSSHPLGSLIVGTIDNPNYPLGFVDSAGTSTTGAFNFSSTVTLQFDYHTVYFVLKQFGIYTNCDFQIDSSLTFNWRTFLGNKHTDVVFQYASGSKGNIVDYNLPRLGQRMVNDLWAIAATTDGKILHSEITDTDSINTYGRLMDATAYIDVKDNGFLKARGTQSLFFTKNPDASPINLLVDENAYPLGQYDIGDIVTVKVKDNVINYQKQRRIVGITVNLHNTGRELTTIQTNAPREADLGA